jgi:GNAT superfamily N-acetyltransferase
MGAEAERPSRKGRMADSRGVLPAGLMIREWDFGGATKAGTDRLILELGAALALDHSATQLRLESEIESYFTESLAGRRRTVWLAQVRSSGRLDGVICGLATLLPCADVGVMDVWVHPALRRRGLGRSLLSVVSQRAYREGIAVIGAETTGGASACFFYESMGFELEQVEARSLLTLDAVNWAAFAARSSHVCAGYRIEYHPGGLAGDDLGLCSQVRDYAGYNPVELVPPSMSSDPLRRCHMPGVAEAAGWRVHAVLAIHEQSGCVVALRQAVVSPLLPEIASMSAAFVLSDHRAVGVGRAISARLLLELRTNAPGLRQVQIWSMEEVEDESRLIAELGFVHRGDRRQYGADTQSSNDM